eukprot:6449217-Lingulodinium_polyedra.AAC.1
MRALATAAGQRLGFKVGAHAGVLLLRHLMPDHVDAMLAIVEAHRWTRPVCHPIRLATPMARPEANPWE